MVGKKRQKWTSDQEKILRTMWKDGYEDREKIAEKMGRTPQALRAKAGKLGLPMGKVKQEKMELESIERMPIKGVVKCHNCLKKIVLSKSGLDRKYMGGGIQKKMIFWHLPGKCLGDPNAHFNQVGGKIKRRGKPSEYER